MINKFVTEVHLKSLREYNSRTTWKWIRAKGEHSRIQSITVYIKVCKVTVLISDKYLTINEGKKIILKFIFFFAQRKIFQL